MPLTISLFGGLRIVRGGVDIADGLPGRQGRALVAYLVLHHGGPIPRDELLDVLWPDHPPTAPDAAFSSVLAKVRRALGRDVINGRRALTLKLPAGSRVDVHELEAQAQTAERALTDDPARALAAAEAITQTLTLALLPDLEGDWIAVCTRRFDEQRRRALEISAAAGIALGGRHLPASERAAAALVAREPFVEHGYALLMQAQAQQGNVAEALRTFEQLRVFLRAELGAPPSRSLLELHESLLCSSPGPPAAEPAALPPWASDGLPPNVTPQLTEGAFVGRQEFSARLRMRWAESCAGQTRLVLLVGDAGVGKTRLAVEFAEEVRARGGMVLYGRADEDALLPHQPFVEVLRHLISYGDPELAATARRDREILCRLLPDLAPRESGSTIDTRGEDHTLRYRLFEAFGTLLCEATARSPLLLVLDDLHWADKPTLLLLRHLLRHQQLTNLLVIGTFRHVEVGRDHPLLDLLTDLRRERRYDRLTLTGLDEAATLALVTDRLGRAVSPCFIQRLREQTEGNAFFIEETIRSLADSGLPADAMVTEASLERLGVPEGVSEIVARRVCRLSSLAEEVLTAASAVGRDFRLGIIAQIVGAPTHDVMCALEESMAAGLVGEKPDSIDVFAFSHALVREVLYGRLSVSRRVRLHHAVAQALEALPEHDSVNPAELAHHFLLARHFTGPVPARRYAIAAGERATELLAYEEAVDHLTLAATLFDDDDEQARCEVLLALGRAQWRAGNETARHTFRTVASSASRRGDADQLARAALGHSARYHESGYAGPHGGALLEEALEALGPGDSPRRALLLSRLVGNAAFSAEERGRTSALSTEALVMARRLGDENVLLSALMARHTTLLHVRHLEERLTLSDEFMQLGGHRRELLVERQHWRLYDLLEAGQVQTAQGQTAALKAMAREMRQPQWLSIAAGWRGLWAELAGDADEAERCAEECLNQGQRAGMRDALSTWAAKLLMLRMRQGRLDEIASHVEQLVRGADVRRTGWRSALGLILAESGDIDGARAIYREELALVADALPQFWLTSTAVLSELCARVHDAEGARRLYAELLPFARRNVVVAYSSCWGPVERYLALLAATYGDDEARGRHARAAMAIATELPAPLLAAELQEQHGDLLTA